MNRDNHTVTIPVKDYLALTSAYGSIENKFTAQYAALEHNYERLLHFVKEIAESNLGWTEAKKAAHVLMMKYDPIYRDSWTRDSRNMTSFGDQFP